MEMNLASHCYQPTYIAGGLLWSLMLYPFALLVISRSRQRMSAWVTPMALAPFFAAATAAWWEVGAFAAIASRKAIHTTAAFRGEALRHLFIGCCVAAFVAFFAWMRDRENAPLRGAAGNGLLVGAAVVVAMMIATLLMPLLPHTAVLFRSAAAFAFGGLLLSIRALFIKRDVTRARLRAGVCTLIAGAACIALWSGMNAFREIAMRP